VAQVMEAEYWQPGLMQQLFDLLPEDGLVEISPILIGEDQVAVFPGGGAQLFLDLLETMRLERTERDIWQWDSPPGAGCFRFCFPVLMLSAMRAVVIGQRTGHMHGS